MARRRLKYEHIVGTLPRLPTDDPSRQDIIDALKRTMASDPIFELRASNLARIYVALRLEKDQAALVLADVNLRLEAVQQLMHKQYEEEGISALRIDDRLVTVRLEPWAKIEDKEAFRLWCESIPELRRQMALHSGTVNTLTRARLVEGEPEPPGVTIYAKPKFTLGEE